jgi:hypothetical protein
VLIPDGIEPDRYSDRLPLRPNVSLRFTGKAKPGRDAASISVQFFYEGQPMGSAKRTIHVGNGGAGAANFRPTAPGVLARIGAWAAGKVFQDIFGEDNDAVVPMRGSYECAPGAGYFPIPETRRHVFEEGAGVNHFNYFGNPDLNAKILSWL